MYCSKKVKLSHIALIIKSLEDTENFYSNILGFEKIYRPNFKSKGLWYRVGDFYLHLILSKTMTKPFIDPINQTAQTHFAIALTDIDYSKLLAKLKSLHIKIISEEFSKETETRQAFFYDPSFNMIEINDELKKNYNL
ncbi:MULTISPECIES: VOC family protein [unclassified Francisella]|uniref:VOC family protein n=1 Tax=unclassified Francisella TaxID=2610885 RepID=UPI002E346854|nr:MULTISPECIES: VOC family protein [unclassified Francisella]MED7819375.1 VOC family protein [Francisella sp. 19S2-4]MED7830168.1 VOC family protein [Francisella sp. 19S2-10]